MKMLQALLLVAVFAPWARPAAAEEPLVGIWRIVSYPTSEGDLLRRHGRAPGPLPDAKASLEGWSYLVFAKDGQCGLFMPQKIKDQSPHRRVTWFHDEDNFATWKLDTSRQPWRLDLGSVLTPKFQTVKTVDAKTGQPISKREAAVDPRTGEVIGQRWTYPAVCRIDGDVLTLVWWQNHRLLENPPKEQRPKMYEGLPDTVLAGLREGKPLLRDDPRVKIPGGVSCLIAQRYSKEPLPILPAPPLREALGK
jgi:hypothetical protein